MYCCLKNSPVIFIVEKIKMMLFISLLSKNIWQIKLWRSTLRQFFVFTYQERQREMAR